MKKYVTICILHAFPVPTLAGGGEGVYKAQST